MASRVPLHKNNPVCTAEDKSGFVMRRAVDLKDKSGHSCSRGLHPGPEHALIHLKAARTGFPLILLPSILFLREDRVLERDNAQNDHLLETGSACTGLHTPEQCSTGCTRAG